MAQPDLRLSEVNISVSKKGYLHMELARFDLLTLALTKGLFLDSLGRSFQLLRFFLRQF